MEKTAIIVAGGSGKRLGTATPKQFLEINGFPVLFYSIEAFLQADSSLKIIVVLPETLLDEWSRRIASRFTEANLDFTSGGSERFLSVLKGLSKTPNDCLVAIHDAARPLITPTFINRLFQEAEIHGCAIPAIHPTETVRLNYSWAHLSSTEEREIHVSGFQSGSQNKKKQPTLVLYPRDQVFLIQTPQVFHRSTLLQSYEKIIPEIYQSKGFRVPDSLNIEEIARKFTDDAAIWESAGHPLYLVPGEIYNLKITRKEDLLFAEFLLKILKKREPGN
ncbi:MAG: IspD/TarI family cytidylyltransferase [Bacteroidales bacterium]